MVENWFLLVSLTVISCPKLHTLPDDLRRVTALKLKVGWCEMLDSLSHGFANLLSREFGNHWVAQFDYIARAKHATTLERLTIVLFESGFSTRWPGKSLGT
ncbi:hypothetical protein V6N13_075879 [Hibiscus sabdariffa]|uniref:Uncharacterized protein n=1 Tax=Hibiscus sabdariffa TaxID=183260 RepID=A0ABR2UD85_9ROSI